MEFIRKILVEERTGAQPHPEDSIFDGQAKAVDALESIKSVIADPGSLTIKWDGFPALVFGRLPDGTFTVQDKYMFDRQFFAKSPADWQRYDANKASGKLRPDLYQKVKNIWAGLEEAVGSSTGFFWGDLLWWTPLRPVKGMYIFQPNEVEYHIPVKSDLGMRIANSVGGVVVHQYFPDSQSKPVQWNQSGLKVNGSVAILTPSVGIKFRLDEPVQLLKAADVAVRRYGPVAEKFLTGIDGVSRKAIQKYFNHKITGQTKEELPVWLQGQISGKQYQKLVGDNFGGYLYREEKGYAALKQVWNSIYQLKLGLLQQLEQQVQGMQQFVRGQSAGEGFVFNTPHGLVKLVNRGVFSAALFGG